MKNVLKMLMVLVIGLGSSICLASGKLTFKPSYDVEDQKTKYQLGLAVYEKLVGPLYYTSWYGAGYHKDAEWENWCKTDQGVEAWFGNLGVGAGGSYKHSHYTHTGETSVYGTVSLTLW